MLGLGSVFGFTDCFTCNNVIILLLILPHLQLLFLFETGDGNSAYLSHYLWSIFEEKSHNFDHFWLWTKSLLIQKKQLDLIFFKFTSFIILLNNKSENNERYCFRSGLSELLRVLRSRQTAEVQLNHPTAAEKRVSHLIVEMWDCMKWIGTVVFSHKSGWELFSARRGSSETFGMTQGEKLPREETKRGGMGLKTSLF